MTPDNRGSTVLPECLPKNDDLLTMKHFILLCVCNQMCVQRSPLGNGKVTVTYRGTAIYTGQLCRKYKATENFGKSFGDSIIQGD